MSTYAPSFGIGNVISRSFRTFNSNALTYVAFTLLAILPIAPIFLLVPLDGHPHPMPPLGYLFEAIGMVSGNVALGAGIHAATSRLRGQPVSFGASLAVGFRRFLPLLGVGVLFGIGVMLGTLLLIVPGVLFALAYYLAFPIVVVEERGVLAGLSRAAELSKGYRATLFALALACVGIMICVIVAVAMLAMIAGFLQSGVAMVAVLVMYAGAYLVIASMQSTLLAVTFHELRTEKEGAAPEKLAGVFA